MNEEKFNDPLESFDPVMDSAFSINENDNNSTSDKGQKQQPDKESYFDTEDLDSTSDNSTDTYLDESSDHTLDPSTDSSPSLNESSDPILDDSTDTSLDETSDDPMLDPSYLSPEEHETPANTIEETSLEDSPPTPSETAVSTPEPIPTVPDMIPATPAAEPVAAPTPAPVAPAPAPPPASIAPTPEPVAPTPEPTTPEPGGHFFDEDSSFDIDETLFEEKESKNANVNVSKVEFNAASSDISDQEDYDKNLFKNIKIDVSIELGRSSISLKKLYELQSGSIVELNRLVGEPLNLVIKDQIIAKGEVVAVNNNYGIRITHIESLSNLH